MLCVFCVELKLYIKYIHKEVILLLHNISNKLKKKIHKITKMCVLNMKCVTVEIAFPTCVHSCTHYFKLLLKGKLIQKVFNQINTSL